MRSIDVVVDKEEPNGCFITAGHGTPREYARPRPARVERKGKEGYTFQQTSEIVCGQERFKIVYTPNPKF